MKRIAYAVVGFLALGTAAASAQPGWGPDRGYWVRERGPAFEDERSFVGPMRPRRIVRLMGSLGLDPVGPPTRQGGFLVQSAADDTGRAVRVTIDLETGQVISVTRQVARVNADPGATRLPGGVPYAGPTLDLDDDFAPPGLARQPRADLPPPEPYPPRATLRHAAPPSGEVSPYPPAVIEGTRPGAKAGKAHPDKSAKANPDKAVPRKRPENAQAATKTEPGTVAPLPTNPAPAGAPVATPAPTFNKDMPPVAPLE